MKWILVLDLILMAEKSLSFTVRSEKTRTSWTALHVARKPLVALTREDGKNDKLMEVLIETLGDKIDMEELPCIAHADGPDLDRLASILTEQEWDYVAVTSPEAARVLATAWKLTSDKRPSVAVVGKATQEELEASGIPVDFCPSKATAATLVKELPAKKETGTTLLYPASAKAATTLQDGLTERGFSVTRLDTYDTVTATWSPEQKERASQVGVACFGSPSAVHGWLENTNENKKVLAACIGETSATACRELQWDESNIFFPEKPGVPGWAKAVEEALSSLQLEHKYN
jgi:uroporphyrinogen-III synthase